MYLTSPAAFVQFYYQSFCQIAYHFSRQIPATSELKVDYAKLAECFSLIDKHGVAHRPAYWELHPGSTQHSSQLGCTRAESIQRWVDHNAFVGKFVPQYVHTQLQKEGTRSMSHFPRSVQAHRALEEARKKADRKAKRRAKRSSRSKAADSSASSTLQPSSHAPSTSHDSREDDIDDGELFTSLRAGRCNQNTSR